MEQWLQEVVGGMEHMAGMEHMEVEGMDRTKVVGMEVESHSRYL